MRPSVLIVCGFMVMVAARLMMRDYQVPASETSRIEAKSTPDSALPSSDPTIQAVNPSVASSVQLPDWENRFFEIAEQPEYLQSQEELEELAAGMNDGQVREALEKLKSERSSAALVFGRALASRWAEKSSEAAAQWAATLPDGDFAQTVSKEVMTSWAAKDLNSTREWVQQLPEGGNKTAAQMSLALAATSQNQGAAAVDVLAGMPANPERDDLLNYSLRQWATVDLESAVTWAGQIQDSQLRERILDNIASGMSDPLSAATFAATRLSAGPGQDNAVVNIIRFWAASAPEDAAGWVTQFPAGSLRTAATSCLLEVWEKDDPTAAAAWAQAAGQQ